VWVHFCELKPRALFVPVLCAAGLLLGVPASASAAEAPVSFTLGHFVYANGETTAMTVAFVEPGGEQTTYTVEWARAGSEWCTSGGVNGTPEGESTPPREVSAAAFFEEEDVEITGLEKGSEYCVQGRATNSSGHSTTGPPATFEAGAPTASALVGEQTGAGTAVLVGEVASAGQPTTYVASYAEVGSSYCSSLGKSGVSAGSTTLPLPASGRLEFVEVPLQGLLDGRNYCAVLSASNETAAVTHIASEAFTMNYVLTVLIGGSGSGRVHTETSRISCPGTCSAFYPPDEGAVLNAEPAPGSRFSGWSVCAGLGKCTFRMNSDVTVSATFSAIPPPVRPAPPPPPTNPPVRKGKPTVNAKTGEIELEYEFPEAGEAEAFGEVTQGSSLVSVPPPPSRGVRSATKRCKKGEVRRGKRCVSNAPVRYGKVTLAVPAAGVQKLHIKPSAKILAASRKGQTLAVRVTLAFTPAGTSDRLMQTSTVTLRMKKPAAHGGRRP
jgi:hypothetical protein